MRDTLKKIGGSGHSREEWTKYHSRLVQIPDKMGGKQRAEKVVKLTELLRNRETIPEYSSTGRQTTSSEAVPGEGESKHGRTTKQGVSSGKEESGKKNKSIKNLTEEVEKTNKSSSQKELLRSGHTSGLTFEAMDLDDDLQAYATNGTKMSNNNTRSERQKSQDRHQTSASSTVNNSTNDTNIINENTTEANSEISESGEKKSAVDIFSSKVTVTNTYETHNNKSHGMSYERQDTSNDMDIDCQSDQMENNDTSNDTMKDITVWNYEEFTSQAANPSGQSPKKGQQAQNKYENKTVKDKQYVHPVQIKREKITEATSSLVN